MKHKQKRAFAFASSSLALLFFAQSAFASTAGNHIAYARGKGKHISINSILGQDLYANKPVIVGTVNSITGNTISVTGKINNSIYSVDATNAKITKGFGTTTTVLNITNVAVGDNVAVFGTISGNNITATSIVDGMPLVLKEHLGGRGIFGMVGSVTGNTLTVTSIEGKTALSSTTYTVDATNASVIKNNATSSLSNIAVGDKVMVKGAITGTNIVATMIRDGVNLTHRNKMGWKK